MINRRLDAHFTVTDWIDIELCHIAIMTGEPLTIQQHHGFITRATVCGDVLNITLKHAGPTLCGCQEELPRHANDL